MSSFFKYADLPIQEVIVIENSGKVSAGFEVLRIVEALGISATVTVNSQNIGQISSIDRAYSLVRTPYIFHCEDDWEFFESGFLAKSKQALDELPEAVAVNIRVRFDGEIGSMHPVSETKTTPSGLEYRQYEFNHQDMWHGFSWNPGLRRLDDYLKIQPYKQYGGEAEVGKVYKDLGYFAICFDESYCRHLGTFSRSPGANQ
jgi:GT2 family glycosyltransferase